MDARTPAEGAAVLRRAFHPQIALHAQDTDVAVATALLAQSRSAAGGASNSSEVLIVSGSV